MKTNAPLRVLMVSTSYPADLNDWRGLFIRHLTDALARCIDLRVSLWAPPGEVHPDVIQVASAHETTFLAQLMQSGGIAHLLRSGGVRALVAPLRLLMGLRAVYRRSDADLYHVNWLQNALPLPNDGKLLLVSKWLRRSKLQTLGALLQPIPNYHFGNRLSRE